MRRIRPNREGLLYPFLLLLDFLLLFLGFYMALQMAGPLNLTELHYNSYVWLWVLLGSVCTLGLFNLYGVFQSPHQGLRECFLSVSIALAFMNSSWVLLDMLIPEFYFPLSWILTKLFTEFVLISGTKLFFHKILSILHKEALTAIIGEKAETLRFLETIFHKNQSLFSVKEILHPDDPLLLQKISKVEVIFICPKIKGSMKKKLVKDCFQLGKQVFIIPELFEISVSSSKMMEFEDVPTLYMDGLGLSRQQDFIKRCVDIVFSILFLLLSLPLFIMIALMIKLYDGGTVFFSQERVTRGGRIYRMYKFRTMIEDAEKETGPSLVREKDPRITPIGAFLRGSRLDELPQLLNILQGDMSLVGPRPERLYFVELLKQEIPDYDLRLSVKAGLTGLAQVLGRYTTAPSDKLKFDLFYIRHYSLLLDLKIILQTVKIMFMKKQSDGIAEPIKEK